MSLFEIGYTIGILGGIALLIWLGVRSIKHRKCIKEGKVKKNFWRDFQSLTWL